MNIFHPIPEKHREEDQLIKGCRRGKKKSQYELVKRYSPGLMSLCRRYAPDEATAQDMLQEAFIRIFTHIGSYEPTGSFEGWMRKITTRCALQWLNKYNLRQELLHTEPEEENSLEPEIYEQLDAEDIIKIIQELPVGFRTVFNLHVIEGYSHKEIAELLEIQESTSRSQLGRARKLLQKKMNLLSQKKYKSA